MIISLLVTPIINPKPVEAADFGLTGLGNLTQMWLHDNGKVRAMDSQGKVAEFNYVTWKIINDGIGSGSGKSHQDTKRGLIFLHGTNRIYDIQNNEWKSLSRSYSLYGNGFYYIVSTMPPNLTVYQYDIHENFVNSVNVNAPQGNYNVRYRVLYTECLNGKNFLVSNGSEKYLFDYKLKNTRYKGYDTTHIREPAEGIGNHAYYLAKTPMGDYSYSYIDIAKGSRTFIQNAFNSSFAIGNSPLGIVASITTDHSNYKIMLNSAAIFSSQYPYTTVCYDKFGNRLFGGPSGRVVVCSPGGMTSTDTNFYSDLLEAETAELARIAATEATKAFNKTQELYNMVNDENTGLLALNTKIDNIKIDLPPKITKVSTINNATATLSNEINVIVNAEDSTKYRAKANVLPTGIDDWEASNIISVGNLTSGINTIYVQATNDSGKITNSTITVFRL